MCSLCFLVVFFFFFSSRRRHTRFDCDWSSDVCSSDLAPVLVLTAKGEEANKVQAFSIGGDDYVTKPFGVLELIARVKALLRRSRGKDDAPIPAVERFGEIEVNPASRTVYRGGRLVPLAPREFDLLMALLRRRGAAASRAELL